MLKLCTKCLREYPATLEYFYKHPRTKDGLDSHCKNCHKKYSKKWRENNPEKIKKWREENPNYAEIWQKENPEKFRNSLLKYNYKISLKEYNQLLKEQNYCCGICGKRENEFKIKLAVHHNHETGKIIGLLCTGCNLCLGIIEIYKKNPAKWDKYLKE